MFTHKTITRKVIFLVRDEKHGEKRLSKKFPLNDIEKLKENMLQKNIS